LTDRVTPRRQCMAAGDFRWRNVHEYPFLFSPLCRTVPRTEGTYCIGYLLLLQLDCPVYTCGQLEYCDVTHALWYSMYFVLGEDSIYMAQNVNRCLYIISLLCNRAPDRLCGLVVRVVGHRSGGPGSIPGTTRKKSSGSGKGSTQPREYNWGAAW
jgi:hypothetical protein